MGNDNSISEQIEEQEEVEIEEFAKKGQEVPKARHYVIRIDKERRVVDSPTITGRQILALVGKTPEMFKLYEHIRGRQPILIGPDEVVHLRAHGVERFTTMPKDTTEGRDTATLRREYRLPEADEDYLNGIGLPWEAVKDSNSQWLIIHAWRVPNGYNHSGVCVALLIPPGYSDSQIDMAYFRPALSRRDNKAIGALSSQQICGEEWQRWSRHRTTANPWRVGIDDVASHLALVDEWLRREFERGV